MNDLTLYETIPKSKFPIRLIDYINEPYIIVPHWHEHIEIHYIFDGTGLLKCGEEEINVKKGQCVIINGNELHQGTGEICNYGCMILPPSFFDDKYIVFERIAEDDTITELFGRIYKSFRTKSNTSDFEIKGYTNLLTAHLIRNYSAEMLSENLYASRMRKLDKINEAIKYINEHFHEHITTSFLAELIHISEGHFCGLFREATGVTAKEYINKVRVKKAEELILSTDMNISEVGICSGFCDANYFTRTFKKYTGKVPSDLRKNA